ncbi:alpha/beta-hydrolase [Macrolepiota fuliginosa MF-IS2]|uniref:Alpha/beta-hydrolase n=1 Tax=Macrolepiota fuliginosa MF-IS2 TaxID=1400762 RepID=A0A9P6BXZ2_9AGAR|nr:alpha/beta-hydrolase [Macrolepiota fuliginosa MF-IS2]
MEFASVDLPTFFDSKTCVRKGLCPVTQLRPQGSEALESHSLYFEQHGRGTEYKILMIMGLNSSSFSWDAQVKWFGGGQAFREGEQEGGVKEEKSTVLVFDNRGVGNSGYPRGPYSTSEMAEDVVCLLDHVGWTNEREVHVVGISLGGMIAQELALRIPERIGSLVLAVTTPGGRPWNNLPPWKGVSCLTRLLFTPDPVKKAPLVGDMLFPREWLEKPNEDEPGKTNRQVQSETFLRRVAITKPQQLMGHVSQMAAGLTHRVSDAQLARISERVPKVTIVTGDEDHLVRPAMSRALKRAMRSAELVEWTGTGHGLHVQHRRAFNLVVERTCVEGAGRR